MKKQRKEEREAHKEAQATPNVVLVTAEMSKQPEESSAEPASEIPVEPSKKKKKATRQYMTVSYEEKKSEVEIKEVPKNKDIFSRVVREKKEEQKKELVKEIPRVTTLCIKFRLQIDTHITSCSIILGYFRFALNNVDN